MRTPRFSLALLGPAQVRDTLTGTGVRFPEKGFVLASYLLLECNGTPAKRDAAALFLWGDTEADKAGANLRSLLARIRRIQEKTGFKVMAADREHVWLTGAATIDVHRLSDLGAVESASSVLEQCALYRGDLLADFDGSSPESSEWLRGQRTALRDLFIRCVTGFLERAHPDAERHAIEAAAYKLLAVDPYQEASYRALMRAYASSGRLRDLERIYRTCRSRFESELGVAPDHKTVQLYHELCAHDPETAGGIPRVTEVQEIKREPGLPRGPAPRDTSGTPGICVLMPPHPSGGATFDLAAALIEDVTIGLCRQRTFTVFAPYTAWRLGPDGPEGSFAEKFGIDYIVQTRIQEHGGDSFLAAKLLDARSRKIAWADRFVFSSHDLGGSYRNLSKRILASLTEGIESAEIDRYRSGGDASAYVAYLLGTRALSTVQLPGIRSARALFKASVKQDGSFAPALGGVARTLHMEWLLLGRGERELLDEAEHFSRRALSADPEGADGLRELALCNLYKGRFDESLEAFAEAERRNPQHADLLADYADALSLSGMPANALGKVAQATTLNPLCPDRYRWYEGTIYYQLEQYEAAVASLSRMTDGSPAYRLMAACWAMLGDTSKAHEFARKAIRIYPEFTVEKWLSMIPIRDAGLKRHYEQGLRSAGFD